MLLTPLPLPPQRGFLSALGQDGGPRKLFYSLSINLSNVTEGWCASYFIQRPLRSLKGISLTDSRQWISGATLHRLKSHDDRLPQVYPSAHNITYLPQVCHESY